MSDTKPVNEASALLFRQATARYANEIQELANMAFRVDGMDPAAFKVDVDRLVYVPNIKPDADPD